MNTSQSIDRLQAEFGLDGRIRFELGQGGLKCMKVLTPTAQAEIYLLGAHLTAYATGGRQWIFMSRQSEYAVGKPIRGGVPVCFPWFGLKADDPNAPIHGVARLHEFEVESVSLRDEDVEVVLRLRPETPFVKEWPVGVTLRHRIFVSKRLTMTLEVENASGKPFGFSAGLHTYFAIDDIHQAEVTGLDKVEYLDKTLGMTRHTQNGVVRFTGETDRVYLESGPMTTIRDGKNIIEIEKEGSNATVVWNPWDQRSRALPDLGDDEWQRMLCVETVNWGAPAIEIADGQTHRMSAHITCRVTRG